MFLAQKLRPPAGQLIVGFDCTSRTHVGHRRKLNEDSLLASVEDRMWVVADGMGGHDAGEVASAMVVDSLAKLPEATSFLNRIGKVVGTLETVNADLIALAHAGGSDRTIGTTVVGLICDDEQFCCFWVGDSRAYRLSGGSIAQISRDHSLVQDLVDAGMLEAERADQHPNANVLTRAVGATEPLKVDTITGPLAKPDLFLLASDGLTKVVREDEIAIALNGGNSLETAADRLLDMVLSRGAPDNVSFVIVRAG